MTTETLIVPDPFCPVDLLLYRRFKRAVPGLVEQVLARNPGLAAFGPYPPVGTKVVVDIPAPVSKQTPTRIITLTD